MKFESKSATGRFVIKDAESGKILFETYHLDGEERMKLAELIADIEDKAFERGIATGKHLQ